MHGATIKIAVVKLYPPLYNVYNWARKSYTELQPSTLSDPYLNRTAVLGAFCLLVAALLHGRQVLGMFGTSFAPPTSLSTHFCSSMATA